MKFRLMKFAVWITTENTYGPPSVVVPSSWFHPTFHFDFAQAQSKFNSKSSHHPPTHRIQKLQTEKEERIRKVRERETKDYQSINQSIICISEGEKDRQIYIHPPTHVGRAPLSRKFALHLFLATPYQRPQDPKTLYRPIPSVSIPDAYSDTDHHQYLQSTRCTLRPLICPVQIQSI